MLATDFISDIRTGTTYPNVATEIISDIRTGTILCKNNCTKTLRQTGRQSTRGYGKENCTKELTELSGTSLTN